MPALITTLGAITRDDLGVILPHEHVFVDLRTWDQPGYSDAETDDVVRLMTPEIEAARAAGVTAIVEPSGIGVGRRADILLAVSRATGFPLVAPTGVYREPWLPPWVRDASEDSLRTWMIGELTGQIEGTGVQAGWIKVAATDEGITDSESKVLRAAAGASAATGATIGSHTLRGAVAREQIAILEGAGGSADHFVWIHAHQELDVAIHHELARQGVWIEYDGIGDEGSDPMFIDLIHRALDAGLAHRLLLSQDRGWYDPAQPGGGTPKPFTYLSETFLPKLAASGVDDVTIGQLMRDNPFAAFAR
ncbi:MAG: parathion hydrolase [uncultured Thermomicrobiales bacterium]|uniref:Parathion hydrolase n=1 Tax=uncultured Thermomicrobiales bacterium TaxID=1645740 RepID=A0A6J4UZJ3_9BACT|nr:MAG: parathion hydrolase [uncultured Thermomicrobiales bacterium]